MFEARNAAFSRVMQLVDVDRDRSDVFEILLRQKEQSKEKAEKENEAVSRAAIYFILGVGASMAAVTTLLSNFKLDLSALDPSSLFVRTREWLVDLFNAKGKEEASRKAIDKTGEISTDAEPSPVSLPQVSPLMEDSDQYRVNPARAGKREQDAIRRAAKSQSVDYALLYAVAGSESSFRTEVSASTSSAVGLFQFTESTWKYLTKEFDLDYTLADRKDPVKAAEVAGIYLRMITNTLTRSLGRTPSYGETYLGYFLGPSGAVSFLKQLKKNPGAIGAKLFRNAARANPNVFYEDGNKNKPLTLRQILAKQEGKIVSYAQDADPDYQAARTNAVSPIQVALADPGKTGGSAQTGGRAKMGGMSKVGSVVPTNSKIVQPRQQSVPGVSTPQERAPSIVAERRTNNEGSQQPLAMPDGRPHVPTTIVRGRDNRLYALNS